MVVYNRYTNALSRLFTLFNLENYNIGESRISKVNLEAIRLLLKRLGNPQDSQTIIHVAGSKGKGSVCSMLESIMKSAGITTGLYSSPSLHNYTERIRINGSNIPEEDFCRVFEEVFAVVSEIIGVAQGNHEMPVPLRVPSVFDVLTAMALLYFKQKNLQLTILETGLGGRLDSTNIVSSSMSVITRICLDHTNILGNTVEEIAYEKAGIIKPKTIVVVSDTQPQSAKEVIINTASKLECRVIDVSKNAQLKSQSTLFKGGQRLCICTPKGLYEFNSPLIGQHQISNVKTAIATVENMPLYRPTVKNILYGLQTMDFAGRIEVVSLQPLIIADGCHEPVSANELVKTIQIHFKQYNKCIFVFGATLGHDYITTARILLPIAKYFIVTQSRHPRSVNFMQLTQELLDVGIPVKASVDNVKEALDTAKESLQKNNMVVGCGSLFTAAEVIQSVKVVEYELYAFDGYKWNIKKANYKLHNTV